MKPSPDTQLERSDPTKAPAERAPAPNTVVTYSHSALFDSMPFVVRDALTTATTQPTVCEGLKLIYVSGGSSTLMFNSGQIDLPLGAFVVLPANHWYIGVPNQAVETLTLYIETDFIRDQTRWFPKAAPFLERVLSTSSPILLHAHPLHRVRLPRVLKRMAELPLTSPGAEFFQLSQLGTLLASLQHSSGDPIYENVLWKTTVDTAIHLLCNNLQSPWSIEKLAHAVALSPSQLSKLFAKSLGTSPSKFLREARAHRMHELLTATGITVYEAGRAVGWTNPSHAARAFRMVFGISPQQSRSNSHVSKDQLVGVSKSLDLTTR